MFAGLVGLLLCGRCYTPQVQGLRLCESDHCRDVGRFWAEGDEDDTSSIIRALTQGRADDKSQDFWNSSGLYNAEAVYSSKTTHPLLVYLPAGVYTTSSTLPLVYYTQLVGEGPDKTIVKFVPKGGSSWCTEDETLRPAAVDVFGGWIGETLRGKTPQHEPTPQNNFYRQIRDLTIDLTDEAADGCNGIAWTLSQATSASNVKVTMANNSDSIGLTIGSGSGGFLADLVFEGGKYGMDVGNQQFTCRNITVTGASAAGVWLKWGWQWTFKSLRVADTPRGIVFGNDGVAAAGALTLLDSRFSNNSVAAVELKEQEDHRGSPLRQGLVLDNVAYERVECLLKVGDECTDYLDADSSGTVDSWVSGYVFEGGQSRQEIAFDLAAAGYDAARPERLVEPGTAGGEQAKFFEKPRPEFSLWGWARDNPSLFVDVTQYGVSPDSEHAVTCGLQQALDETSERGQVLFLPHGNYMVDDTLLVRPGARLLGEAWTNIIATNRKDGTSAFSDPDLPTPLLKVGKPGDRGLAQMVDLNLMAKGPQLGCVLLEWNVADPEGERGSAGTWEVHMRVGGSNQTRLTARSDPTCSRKATNVSADGPTLQDLDNCGGVWALMRVTEGASVYVENMWGWVADHDLDNPELEFEENQVNIYSARGFLSESAGPVWLYGTGMEHNILYQYNLHGASNVLMALIQTEQPYFQPVPGDRSEDLFYGLLDKGTETDPEYCVEDQGWNKTLSGSCEMAYSLHIQDSSNISLYGAGLYAFYSHYNQDCLQSTPIKTTSAAAEEIWRPLVDEVDRHEFCQAQMVKVNNSENVRTHMLSTYGGVYMKTIDEPFSKASLSQMALMSTAIVDLTSFGDGPGAS